MSTWPKNELLKIAATDDLHISPFRDDGNTYGTPTWIWSVVVDDVLYVRDYNGQTSRWYQAALRQKAGRITAAGSTIDVAFEPVEGAINDRIDDAYRVKYKSSPYLAPMIGTRARGATVRVVPRKSQQRRSNPMPHVIVKLWPGKSEEQKRQLADAIARDVHGHPSLR